MTPTVADRHGEADGPRRFVDARGVEWEVRERPLPRDDWTSADEDTHRAGYPVGWLDFTAGETRKWLRLFPPRWWTLGDAELERLCHRARAAG